MAKLALPKAAVSQTVLIFIQDSTSTTGAGKTGLAFNTAGLTAYYARPRAAAVAITLATQTVTGAFASGGFVEIDATNMPGVYRLDIPDAALATGVDSVVILLKGATGMAPLPLEIQLTNVNLNDATSAGLARLDAAITTRATPAQVNAEVVDALNVDTYAEPGQGTPPATATLVQRLQYLYKAWRNRATQTASQYSLYGDDATTVHHKATFVDNGTTADRGEVTTGP